MQLPTKLLIAAALLVAACGSLTREYPEVRDYALAVQRSGADATATFGAESHLLLRPFTISPSFDKRAFILRTGESAYRDDYYSRFMSSPPEMVRHEVGRWMDESALFGTVSGSSSIALPTHVLEGHVVRWCATTSPEPTAELELQLTLFDVRSGAARAVARETFVRAQAATDPEPASLVAAWTAALASALEDWEALLVAVAREDASAPEGP